MNDPYVVDEYANDCSAVHELGLFRFNPTVLAVPPLYEPENVRVESVAVKSARLFPRATPEIVELVRPALFSVPDIVGVSVNAPLDGIIVIPAVSPLNEDVVVENVTAVCVVEAYPDPSVVR